MFAVLESMMDRRRKEQKSLTPEWKRIKMDPTKHAMKKARQREIQKRYMMKKKLQINSLRDVFGKLEQNLI